jgi:hypothetical protein
MPNRWMTVSPRRGQRLSAALVAAQAGEGHHSADIAPPRGQSRALAGGIEGLGLDADRCWHGIAAPYGS